MPFPTLNVVAADMAIYRAVSANGNAGSHLSLRQAILALSGGVAPTTPVLQVEITPVADLRVYRSSLAANAGGNYVVVPAGTTKVFPVVTALDSLVVLADGAGATTFNAVFHLDS